MPPYREPIDDLVRQHLDREAATVDASAILARIHQQTEPRRSRGGPRLASLAALLTVAASLAVVFLFNPATPQLAAAEQLLREAQVAHTQPGDHRYEVVTDWDLPFLKRFQVGTTRQFSVWTRGDEFYVTNTYESQPKLALGQGSDSRIWLALTRKRGLIYDSTELTEPFTRLCDLFSLRTVRTLRDVLEQFQCFRKDTGQPGEPIRIVAQLRPNFLNRRPPIREIVLELDPHTKLIRSASMKRVLTGEQLVTVTFTLVELGNLPDSAYTLQGHLDPDAEVFDSAQAEIQDRRTKWRDDFLKRWQHRGK